MDRSKPVSFLASRLMSGSYVAFRQAGVGLTEEAAIANRSSSALYGNGALGDSAEMLLHTEEQVRMLLDSPHGRAPVSVLACANRSLTYPCISLSSRRCASRFVPASFAALAHLHSPAQAMAQRSVHGAIDLDDLEPDSPLVTMKTLHLLRFNGGPLDPVRHERFQR